MPGILGIDLDNTIIDYEVAYREIAEEFGLPETARNRRGIREALGAQRARDDEWQRFQSVLYTRGLAVAKPTEGVLTFLDTAISLGWRISIVSHKTHRTQERFGSVPMREAATRWLMTNGVIPRRCAADRLYYEETLEAKMERIGVLGCDVFIDDLDAVVLHRERPTATRMVHFVPGSKWIAGSSHGVAGQGDFQAICEWIRDG